MGYSRYLVSLYLTSLHTQNKTFALTTDGQTERQTDGRTHPFSSLFLGYR